MDFSKKIRPGERVLKIIRRHPLTFGWNILAAILLIAISFLLLWPLFRLGTGGVIIFYYLIFLGLVLTLTAFLRWYHNFVMVTDQRTLIYRHYSALEKEVLSIMHERLGDISYKIKGFGGNLGGYGQIKIEYAYRHQKNKLYLKNIPHPREFQDLLLKLRDQALKRAHDKKSAFLTPEEILKQATMEDLFEVIRQVKNLIGEEKFCQNFLDK